MVTPCQAGDILDLALQKFLDRTALKKSRAVSVNRWCRRRVCSESLIVLTNVNAFTFFFPNGF